MSVQPTGLHREGALEKTGRRGPKAQIIGNCMAIKRGMHTISRIAVQCLAGIQWAIRATTIRAGRRLSGVGILRSS
jgi:hypothetical protein